VVAALVFAAVLVAWPCRLVWGQELPELTDLLGVGENDLDSELADFEAPFERAIPIPADTAEVTFPFGVGRARYGATVTLVWHSGRKTDIRFRVADATYKEKVPGDELRFVKRTLPDACLDIPALKARYFVRPNPAFYSENAVRALRDEWGSLPSPDDHPLVLSLQLDAAGAALSLDGNYVGRVDQVGGLKEVIASLPAEAEAKCRPREAWSPWTPLELRSLARPGAMSNAVLNVDEDALKATGIPMRLLDGGASADVGCVRDVSPRITAEGPYCYYERSALEGLRTSLLMSVPVAPYTRAWVLCAAEDDPAKNPAFNVRLTRYRKGGIGNAMVTTSVDVPREETEQDGLHCVGRVEYVGKDGKTTVPLWLAEVSLNSSEIQDVVYGDWHGGRLDFELKGRHRDSKSGVHVFAVTLEQSPVEMEVKQVIPGSVFHNREQPEMKVALRPRTAGVVALKWAVQDVWCNEVATGKREYSFAEGGESQEVSIPLKMKEDGWYQVVFSLQDKMGRLLLAHTAAYAQLPPDTRKAGYESPFGCWWQQYLHSHMTDPKIIGPLLFKAGIRRTTHTAQSEAVMKPWNVTIDMVPWFGGYRTPGAPKLTLDEWQAEYEARVSDYVEKFPHVGLAMVFHESYRSSMAPEVWGGEPDPLSAHGLIEKAKLACALLREKYPNLKIIVGNSGWSGALISQLLRGGLPADQIDGLGMERLIGYFAKDSMPPERHEASWTLRQTALQYGCKAPPTDCYESGGRGNYGMSQRLIAEYVVRDSLVGLAWGYPYIGVGVISENVNGYYHTRWGGDSILRRTPLLYPQPQYVAIATMTRMLDRVKLVQRVPTGSHTAYALEFARGIERVYALWTPRGSCDMALTFPRDSVVKVHGHYGRARPSNMLNAELHVEATEEVTYVTASAAATAVIAGARAFPLDQPPDDAVIIAPLKDPAAWVWTHSKALERGPFPYAWLPWRTAGKGKLSATSDPEKGDCLRLELIPKGKLPDLVDECLSLQVATPLSVPGKPHTIGVWVKGNSCWGRVIFEIMDAEGERFRGGQYKYEPRGTSYINFDGWCFVALPLSDKSPVRDRFYYSPGTLWTGSGGNGEIDYPIRVTGLAVTLKRKALDLADMASVEPSILLKDLSLYGAPGDMAPGVARTLGVASPVSVRPDTKDHRDALYSDGDLRHVALGSRPPGFTEGCVLKEEDGRRYVSCERGTRGLFKNLSYHGSRSWLDYEWSFRFRFPSADKLGFTCKLRTGLDSSPFLKAPRMGPEDKCKGVRLDISAQGFDPRVVDGMFQMAGGSTWTEKGLPPLEAGRWYQIVIRAAGRALDLSLEHEGRQVSVYRGPIPAGGGGVDLASPHPIDLADIRISEVVPTDEDWSHAGRIRTEDESPVQGTTCTRIDGPLMITDAITLADREHPCILSAYIRSDEDGVPVTMIIGNRTKIVRATKQWARYSFLATPPQEDEKNIPCTFGLKGSDEGVVRFAAPQVEYAPFDPDAKRAVGWERALETDYTLDDQVAHGGHRSLRAQNAGRTVAVQEGEFAEEDPRSLALGGWLRTDDGAIKEAKLKLEVYRDKKHWIPRTLTEEEPQETFIVPLKSTSRGWEYVGARFSPRNSVKRFRLSLMVDSAGGTVWLDDLVLRPLGRFAATPDIADSSADLFGEEAGEDAEMADEVMAILGSIDIEAAAKDNILRNPGFETFMTNRLITAESDRPSSYALPERPATWMKTKAGRTP